MKYLKQIAAGAVLALLAVGCKSGDWSFPDYEGGTTVCFPFQTPVRTIILGEANEYEVTNDHEKKFEISVSMGGVYENKVRRVVKYEMAEDLIGDIRVKDGGDVLEVLPSEYYTLSDYEQFIIPVGREDGRITVQLNDAFFQDPHTHKTHYVIPMRIVEANVDSIHGGTPKVVGVIPDDIRFEEGWTLQPKNYTLFGIKYQNKYHGKYLLRGKTKVYDIDSDELLGEVVYSAEYIERNEQIMVSTNSLNTCYLEAMALRIPAHVTNNPELYPGAENAKVNILATFDEETDEIQLSGDYNVKGTGHWLSKDESGESWGNKDRSAMYIQWEAEKTDSYLRYEASDTLVYMSNMVAVEIFSPELIQSQGQGENE